MGHNAKNGSPSISTSGKKKVKEEERKRFLTDFQKISSYIS